jgi:glycerophosphoryl diester phosphodiesterase
VQGIYLTKKFVERAHEEGIKVNCWTIDKPEEAETMLSYGVDFITTNILE